jgi:hypothetical protein
MARLNERRRHLQLRCARRLQCGGIRSDPYPNASGHPVMVRRSDRTHALMCARSLHGRLGYIGSQFGCARGRRSQSTGTSEGAQTQRNAQEGGAVVGGFPRQRAHLPRRRERRTGSRRCPPLGALHTAHHWRWCRQSHRSAGVHQMPKIPSPFGYPPPSAIRYKLYVRVSGPCVAACSTYPSLLQRRPYPSALFPRLALQGP